MDVRVKDLMSRNFITIAPTATLQEAVETMNAASASAKGRRIFGLMVTNDDQELLGMIAMYDIFYYIRPYPSETGKNTDDIVWEKKFEEALAETRNILVSDVMTKALVTVTEDTHIMEVIDLIIKKHIRRLPVVEGKKLIGVVYISDVFYEVYKKLLP